MNLNPISIIIIVSFIYPILKGLIYKYSSFSLKKDIQDITSNISFIISLLLGITLAKKVFFQHEIGIWKEIYRSIPKTFILFLDRNPLFFYLAIVPITIYIIYKIINFLFYLINNISIFRILDSIEKNLRGKSEAFRRIIGGIFQIPKAICFLLVAVFLINIFSIFNTNNAANQYIQNSEIYNVLCREIVIPASKSKLAKQLPKIINNSFKIQIKDNNNTVSKNNSTKGNAVIYYNGVTLDEGVKSNPKIDTFAKKICSGENTEKRKGSLLYNWVGQNIDYDQNKAQMIMNNDFREGSGAIPTFYSKKGICFDYACLYVAMCRANGISVRLITGEGFNGISWVNHAWNQIYIPEEDKWINVDATFYKGGNYFDSRRFFIDHKDASIAGEWKK